MGAGMLWGLGVNRSNQVWALVTTYIPAAKGFVSLTAGVDWASRKVLAAKIELRSFVSFVYLKIQDG